MQFRQFGPTGIKVSAISFGNSTNSTSENAQEERNTIQCLRKAWQLGVNYFDASGSHEGQRQLGKAIKQLNVSRHKYIVSTKISWENKGNLDQIPNKSVLSRKHILSSTKDSLIRLGLDYVDLIYCHQFDDRTAMEEICRSFDWLVQKGYTNYWGTSEWNQQQIAQALFICKKYKLVKPVVEQLQYNILQREKLEISYRNCLKKKKIGISTCSPFLRGILNGKCNKQISKQALKDIQEAQPEVYKNYFSEKQIENTIQKLGKFDKIAQSLSCSMPQLALAWCLNNPDVSAVRSEFQSVEEVETLVKAVEVKAFLTRELELEIEDALKNLPTGQYEVMMARIPQSRRFELLCSKQ